MMGGSRARPSAIATGSQDEALLKQEEGKQKEANKAENQKKHRKARSGKVVRSRGTLGALQCLHSFPSLPVGCDAALLSC